MLEIFKFCLHFQRTYVFVRLRRNQQFVNKSESYVCIVGLTITDSDFKQLKYNVSTSAFTRLSPFYATRTRSAKKGVASLCLTLKTLSLPPIRTSELSCPSWLPHIHNVSRQRQSLPSANRTKLGVFHCCCWLLFSVCPRVFNINF